MLIAPPVIILGIQKVEGVWLCQWAVRESENEIGNPLSELCDFHRNLSPNGPANEKNITFESLEVTIE